MKNYLSQIVLVINFLFAAYIIAMSLNIAGALSILFLGATSAAFLLYDYKVKLIGRISTTNTEINKLQEELEIENLKSTIERIQYQNITDKAKRDERAIKGKQESTYVF